MGSILNTLAKNSTYCLTDDLKSGIMLTFQLEEGDEKAFDFLGYRYEDMGLLHDNKRFVPIDDNTDFDDTPYPHTYEIDASAIVLAFNSSDNGFSSLASQDVKSEITDQFNVLSYNNSVLNMISDDCEMGDDEPEVDSNGWTLDNQEDNEE